jgi:hypothetical protein
MKTNDINVAPVKKYTPPKYPTITSAKNDPDLLLKLPSRWEKNATVVVAASMIGVMTLTSCGILEPKVTTDGIPAPASFTSEQEITYKIDETTIEPFILMDDPAPDVFTTEQDVTEILTEIETQETTYARNFLDTSYIMPAPGGIGPAVYISEADFFTIITGMAETHGLKLEELPPNLEDAPLNYLNTTKKLYDAEKQVGVEYRGRRSSIRENYISSEGIAVGTFDTSRYADEFREIWNEFLQKVEEIPFDENSIEYGEQYNNAWTECDVNMQVILEEQLREQVQDFIEWLQGQGII